MVPHWAEGEALLYRVATKWDTCPSLIGWVEAGGAHNAIKLPGYL